MPKFSTPYDTLLRVRRIEEDRAKAELAAANHEVRAATGRLDDSRRHYTAATRMPDGETDLTSFTAHAFAARMAADAVGVAAAALEKSDEARRSAVDVVRAASMRTQGLERLVDRARQARHDEMLAADQRTAEESRAGRRRPTPATAAGTATPQHEGAV